MSAVNKASGQGINVTGSGNNIAVGAGSHAGNTVYGSGQDSDARALLEQIRSLAAASPDRIAGEQAQAAVAAIEADLAKPREHRFSFTGALTALSKLGAAIPGLEQLVDVLIRVVR